jgi:hypothetical protein
MIGGRNVPYAESVGAQALGGDLAAGEPGVGCYHAVVPAEIYYRKTNDSLLFVSTEAIVASTKTWATWRWYVPCLCSPYLD